MSTEEPAWKAELKTRMEFVEIQDDDIEWLMSILPEYIQAAEQRGREEAAERILAPLTQEESAAIQGHAPLREVLARRIDPDRT